MCVHEKEIGNGSSQPDLVSRDDNILKAQADHLLTYPHNDWVTSHLELCALLRADVHPIALMSVTGQINGHECSDGQNQMAHR